MAPPPPDDEIKRLRKALARAVDRACPSWLRNHADDLVQIALQRVMDAADRRKKRLQQEEKPEDEENPEYSASYLQRVAHNAVVDAVRSWRRQGWVSLDDETRHQFKAPGADPEQGAIANELGREIRGCVQELVEARRRPVILHLMGHSVVDVAARLELGVKQAENLVYRGLADLRRCLESRGMKR